MKNMKKLGTHDDNFRYRDTSPRILYNGAMITLDEYNLLLHKNQRKVTPEQDAEYDRVIAEMLKVRGLS